MVGELLRARRLPMQRRSIGVHLALNCSRLLAQPRRLREALDNLIGNAVRFAPDGSEIEIGSACDGGRCTVWVRDHGPGVPDDLRDAIFQPFVRGEDDRGEGVRGTGIGLAIVREAARAHGGDAMVENAHPGARFTIHWSMPEESDATQD